MTVLDGFMPSAAFKEEYHEPMGFEHVVPSNAHQKPRRSQMPPKPVEDYRYFVALVLVEDGSLQFRSSQDMKPYKRVVLEDAYHRFNEVMSDYIQQPGPSKRHRSVNHSSSSFMPRDPQFSPCSRKSGKRRHPGAYHAPNQPFFMHEERKSDVKQPAQSGRQLQIRVDDHKAQEKWFSDAFKAVQQVGCRTIAKVWIKKIHPKKQSTHPYNGGFPRDQQADPERTRPPYWPPSVIHKEPDHIDRSARTALLVHLIMNTPQPQIKSPQESDASATAITARELFLALEEKRNDFKLDRWSIISEIISAREQIEQYEVGGFDPDTIIHVPDFSERSGRGENDGDGDENDLPAPEPLTATAASEESQDEENATTPIASTAPSPSQHAQSDRSRVGQRRKASISRDNDREPMDQSSAHDTTDAFAPASNSFASASSQEDSSAMVVDTHSYAAELKRDRSNHRLQQLRMPHEVNGFSTANNRHHQELLAQQWMANTSPSSYIPHGYDLDNLHAQTNISLQHFRMADGGLMPGDLQELSMSSGLPILDSMQFDEYPPHSRPHPVRALSTPHHMMLDHNIHGGPGLGVVQPSFYAG